jgi:type II secretory pathway pseudopilin PulG
MHWVKKFHFTLLELFIVLLIISLGMALTGVKIKGFYQEQRFLSETQQVVSHLTMAQDLMLITDADVEVHFALDKKNKALSVWIEIEKPLEKSWAHLIERKLSLHAIRSFKFDKKMPPSLTLRFSLGKMSEGKLILYESNKGKDEKKRHFVIDLLGYPCRMGCKQIQFKKDEKKERGRSLYPTEVYKKLYEETNEKNKI